MRTQMRMTMKMNQEPLQITRLLKVRHQKESAKKLKMFSRSRS